MLHRFSYPVLKLFTPDITYNSVILVSEIERLFSVVAIIYFLYHIAIYRLAPILSHGLTCA